MKENIDFIYVGKADINEGLMSGTVTKASLVFTKKFLFVVPVSNVNISGCGEKFKKTHEYLQEILPKAGEMNVEAFEREMFSFLLEDRIFVIEQMETFSVQVGFGIFGGMHIRRPGEEKKVFNIQPKQKRKDIQMFFGLK